MKTVVVDGIRVAPSKVVCIGRNYVEHIKELNNEMPSSMVLFMKPNSALSNELTTRPQTTLHYEGEISFLIRKSNIYAVAFGLDLTDRALQSELKGKGLPWDRAKAFNGAAVMSAFVSIDPFAIDQLTLKLWINDVLVQEGGVDLMIHKPLAVIEEINSFSTLIDNDILMSGTPKGVGSYQKGDKFLGKIFVADKEIISKEWIAE